MNQTIIARKLLVGFLISFVSLILLALGVYGFMDINVSLHLVDFIVALTFLYFLVLLIKAFKKDDAR